jgi:aminoglycoside 6'-N-acetyltransferase
VGRGALTTLRPATDADADLLVKWHADPDVARYWDDETFTRDQMLERLRRPEVDHFIVHAADRPVGYVQAWREGEAGGIDMFLIPDARGRGLGPDAARALARHLRDERGWTSITVDPYASNERAIRAWRKAGFVDAGQQPPDDDHTATWLLMVWDG